MNCCLLTSIYLSIISENISPNWDDKNLLETMSFELEGKPDEIPHVP